MPNSLKLPFINEVRLVGNLTRDPELRYIPSGAAVCTMGLAVNRKYKDKDGETHEDILFIDVTAWTATAEWVGESLHKGYPIYVEGRLKMESWEDKNTGDKRTKIGVTASRIQELEWHSPRAEDNPKPDTEPVPEDDIPF